MKANTGRRTADGCAVTVSDDGGELALTLRLDLRRHSLTSFEWGYGAGRTRQKPLKTRELTAQSLLGFS